MKTPEKPNSSAVAKKKRADMLLVERGLVESRAKAQAVILAGSVLTANGERIDKPGQLLAEDCELSLKGETLRYVSRGGLKLEAALDKFGVQPQGRICLDVGASTGGFTDCLLQRGAQKVYAVDVGYGQLAWRVRQDPRVVVIERENIRTLEATRIAEPVSLIVFDVSFISLRLVMVPALRFAAPKVIIVALVKPQFEVGKGKVGKGGIVRDEQARQDALANIIEECKALGFVDVQWMISPILGATGNQEFLLSGHRP